MSERKQKLETIFQNAIELDSQAQREVYLSRVCGGDSELRGEVEELLHAAISAEAVFEAREQPMGEKLGSVIGRYKLREKIGEGGCGIVYVAEQEEPVRRRVALKVIKLGMDTKQVVARFEAERQALAMMDHPNIAKVLDAGATETGRPYFVMELVRGIKITDYCDQNHLSTRERLELFVLLCRAVQHAHQKGIIHRDLKPSNILVTVHDGAPVPKVIDFGIAKATEGRLTDLTVYTALHQFIGTPAYMSPEQAETNGVDIDTRSDIYSLGVLLYELLTGKTPFDAKELWEAGLDTMRRTLREKEPLRPSTRLSTMLAGELTLTASHRASEAPKLVHLVRGDLDWIVMKALEKDRRRRYDSATGLGLDIERYLSQEPVVARPPSNIYRFQKLVRRHRWTGAAVTAVLASLLFGIAATTWQAVRATRLGNRALASEREARHLLYVANLNLAEQAWEENSVDRVRDLLKDAATNPERGFEWYYWQRQTHLPIKTLPGHTAGINAVAFSPDGQRILTGSSDRTARMWDATLGTELFTFEADSYLVRSVAFSPNGRWIVTGGKDETKLRDAASGKELLKLKDSAAIRCVVFSPDGRRIAAGGWGQTAKVWDATTGDPLFTLNGHSTSIWSIAFSPRGDRIVTGSKDATAMVWDAADGHRLFTLKGHFDSVSSVAYSPDGRRIVTGSGIPSTIEIGKDQTAKVWDSATGDPLVTLTGHSGQINSVAFSPDGQWIVTGSHDQTARIWNAVTGKQVYAFKGHSDVIWSVSISRDGQRIVTGSDDLTARVWSWPIGKDPLTLLGHTAPINSVAFSPNGQQILTGSWDGLAKIWNATNGQLLRTLQGHTDKIDCAAYALDGKRIVTGSADKTAIVWDAETGKKLHVLAGHEDRVESVAFSPDGQKIISGSLDHTAKVWETGSGRFLFTLTGHTDWILSIAFSPNGRRIVTGGGLTDHSARIWDAVSGKQLHSLEGHREGEWSVAFSPDGQKIVTGSGDRTAKVWDVESGKELRTLKGHGDQIFSAAFSPGGRRIVTGCMDGTAKVWDAASGKELLTLKGHTAQVRSVAFSPDGNRIATASWDQTVKIWQAATIEQVNTWQREEVTGAPRPP